MAGIKVESLHLNYLEVDKGVKPGGCLDKEHSRQRKALAQSGAVCLVCPRTKEVNVAAAVSERAEWKMRAERWEVGGWEPWEDFEQRPNQNCGFNSILLSMALTSESTVHEECKIKLPIVVMVSWVSTCQNSDVYFKPRGPQPLGHGWILVRGLLGARLRSRR